MKKILKTELFFEKSLYLLIIQQDFFDKYLTETIGFHSLI